MNWVDYIILGILAVSALISLQRGFVREALSLLGWIMAFWVALSFAQDLAARLATVIPVPSVRMAVAFLALFLTTLLLTALVNYLAGHLIDMTGLSGTDRVLGIVFGIARGTIVVAVLLLLAGFTTLPQDPWWRESRLIGYFLDLAGHLRHLLPTEMMDVKRISFQSGPPQAF
jgi:membrane protein required for colicin V production